MALQAVKNRQGWLDKNWSDLKELEKKNSGYIQVHRRQSDTFDIVIYGKGKFKRYKLHLRCYWKKPSIPPKFMLVNKDEINNTDHPHLTSLYGCLKIPWTPNTPLSLIVDAVKNVWWHPATD
ncbi:MAG: hypothetical protein QXD95_07540 [Nitrososphaeria archaeon]